MLSRRRRAPTRGAAALLLLGATWLLVVAGLGAGEVVAVTATDARAETAAAAAAHAAEAELASRPDASGLSIELQGGRTACELPGGAPPAACLPAYAAAVRVAGADGARVVAFLLGPDPRDRGAEAAPGRIVAVATVEVVRGLPLLRGFCAAPSRRSSRLCVARATAAARVGSPGQ